MYSKKQNCSINWWAFSFQLLMGLGLLGMLYPASSWIWSDRYLSVGWQNIAGNSADHSGNPVGLFAIMVLLISGLTFLRYAFLHWKPGSTAVGPKTLDDVFLS